MLVLAVSMEDDGVNITVFPISPILNRRNYYGLCRNVGRKKTGRLQTVTDQNDG